MNAVTDAKEAYVQQNAFFAEHIKSVASSDWALTGCVREHTGDFSIPLIQVNPENTAGKNVISLLYLPSPTY